MDIQIGNPSYAYLALAVLMSVLLGGYAVWARRRAVKRFATSDIVGQVLPSQRGRKHGVSLILVATVLGLITIAVVDIRWGKTTREVPQKGLEVVFALDVSRSMLAEDVAPNRLQRAKQQITDMIDEMAGDRIGLVIFAGEALQSVPLTTHYDDFRYTLESVGPQSLHRGGSRLGEAIRVATEAFITKTNDHKAVVLFTDGEDQESEPIEAAREAFVDRGIRIFTVGLGDIEQGAVVPLSGQDRRGRPLPSYLRYQGEIVRTKLDGKVLKQIATETDGAYIPAGTQRVNMADVYHKYVANVGQAEFDTVKAETYTPRFQWFAAPALVLLLLEVLLSTRRHSTTRSLTTGVLSGRRNLGRAAMLGFVVLVASSSTVRAQEVDAARRINAANELVREGKFAEALEKYAEVDAGSPQTEVLAYDRGVALFLAGDWKAAGELFAESAGSGDTQLAARSRFNLGNCCYAEALSVAEQDKPTAIEKLKQAIKHYRGSLVGDPSLIDARANIELAAALIRQLQETQKQDEQSSPDQQPSPQNQEQPGEDQQPDDSDAKPQPNGKDQSASGENQSASGDDQTSKQQPQQTGDNPSNPQDSGTDKSGEDKTGDDKTGDDKTGGQDTQDSSGENAESSDAPKPNDGAKNDAQSGRRPSAADADKGEDGAEDGAEDKGDAKGEDGNMRKDPGSTGSGAEESASQANPSQANEPQAAPEPTDPTGELSAAEGANEGTQGEDEAPGTGAMTAGDEFESQPQGRVQTRYLTREEAMKMLQAVRDRDMLRRLQLERSQQAHRFNVEKDW